MKVNSPDDIDMVRIVDEIPEGTHRLRAFTMRAEKRITNERKYVAAVRLTSQGPVIKFSRPNIEEVVDTYVDLAFAVFHEILHILEGHLDLQRIRSRYRVPDLFEGFNSVRDLEEKREDLDFKDKRRWKILHFVNELEIKHMEHVLLPDRFHEMNRKLYSEDIDRDHVDELPPDKRILYRENENFDSALYKRLHSRVFSENQYSPLEAFRVLDRVVPDEPPKKMSAKPGDEDSDSDCQSQSQGVSGSAEGDSESSEGSGGSGEDAKKQQPGGGGGGSAEKGDDEEEGEESEQEEQPGGGGGGSAEKGGDEDQDENEQGAGGGGSEEEEDEGGEGEQEDKDDQEDGEGQGDGQGEDEQNEDEQDEEEDSGVNVAENDPLDHQESGIDEDARDEDLRDLVDALEDMVEDDGEEGGPEEDEDEEEPTEGEPPEPVPDHAKSHTLKPQVAEAKRQRPVNQPRNQEVEEEIKNAGTSPDFHSKVAADINDEVGRAIQYSVRPNFLNDHRARIGRKVGRFVPKYKQTRAPNQEKIALYYDISGSQTEYIPACNEIVLQNKRHLADQSVFLFSTELEEMKISKFSQLAQQGEVQNAVSTYGTNFNVVVRHAKENGFRKIVVLTDDLSEIDRPLIEPMIRGGKLEHILVVCTIEKEEHQAEYSPGFIHGGQDGYADEVVRIKPVTH